MQNLWVSEIWWEEFPEVLKAALVNQHQQSKFSLFSETPDKTVVTINSTDCAKLVLKFLYSNLNVFKLWTST